MVYQSDESNMSGLQELNFNPEVTWKAQLAGREDAKASLADDKSVNVKDFFVEWLDNEDSMQSDYKKVGDYIKTKVKNARTQNE